MDNLNAFLDLYGLAAIFVLMLIKSAGVPIPIPADAIMLATAARAVEGRLILWQAFILLLVALVIGGTVQYALARRLGRGFLTRFGRYIGITRPGSTRWAVGCKRVEPSASGWQS